MYCLVRLVWPDRWELVGSYSTWDSAFLAKERYGGPDSFVWSHAEYMKIRGYNVEEWDHDPPPF